MSRTYTPEEAADRIIEALESKVPGEHHGAAAVDTVETLCREAMYPVALAFFRRHPSSSESHAYNVLMDQARRNGHDETLVFASLYGGL